MKSYELTKSARQDLDSIINYIAERNLQSAKDIHGKLIKACRFLAENPNSGRERLELTTKKDYKFYPAHSNYLIVYKIENANKISIRNFLHTARDIPALLN